MGVFRQQIIVVFLSEFQSRDHRLLHRRRRADGQKGKMSPKKKAAFAKQRAKKADGGRKDGSKR